MSKDFDDDFVFVRHKRKPKKFTQIVQPVESSTSEESNFNRESCIRRILEAKEDILTSDFYESIRASLREGLQLLNGPRISGIICFGLGKFTECMTSRYQFALLLIFRDMFSNRVSAYDPVFTTNEREILTHFNIKLIKENIEGKYNCENTINSEQSECTCEKVDECCCIKSDDFDKSDGNVEIGAEVGNIKTHHENKSNATIFFLPHCPKQLSNNLLWANWSFNLSECVIIANSFNRILESNTNREIHNNAEYLLKISPYVTELAVINSFRYYDIFNDTAVHIFPKQSLALLTDDFWEDNNEPIYEIDDVEFIQKS